jgi:hypothetical protein
MKRVMQGLSMALALGLVMALSGCIYDPGYYHRGGVVYSDGTAGPAMNGNAAIDYADDADDGYAYAPDYYYPGYYGAWPYWGLGLGFYGGYYCCGHGYRGPWGHGHYPHGGWSGGYHGGSHSSGSSGGHSHH